MIKNNILNIISRIKSSNFEKEYSEFQSIDNKNKLSVFQHKYLKKMFMHAYKNVPYYRSIFKKNDIIKNDDVDFSKFNRIPILTKTIIRKNFKELVSEDLKQRRWFYNSSGGSTGEPLRFIQDSDRNKWSGAVNHYYYKDILGVDEKKLKKVFLWGSERDIIEGTKGLKAKIKNWLENTIFLNSFRMTEEDMDMYIKIINFTRPDIIRGYTGSLYEFCRYIEKKNIKIYKPKLVACGAETLSEEKREKIEKILETKLYDFYGSRETSSLAAECKHGLMHMLMFNNYIEILNKNNEPVADGEEGRIIVTCLHNYAMPLIRYDIGDTALLGPEECKCGNPLPTIKKITGRITDNFIKKNGTIIYGEYFTHLFYLKDWVKAFQVVQEDYQKIKVLVVLNNKIKEIEKEDIENKIKLVMGNECRILWEFVEDMPITGSKHLYTKSKISFYE